MKRVFLIVLDSFGIGEMPDAAAYGDAGSNTLRTVADSPEFSMPNMAKLGLFNIDGVTAGSRRQSPGILRPDDRVFQREGYHHRPLGDRRADFHEADAGLPEGFPAEVIRAFEEKTGRKVLCNRPYSGTEVIKDYGEEHMRTGSLIVYTSADSVFQIAAHEEVVPVEELYRYCEIARRLLVGDVGVGRVIARPFTGEPGNFTRTSRRHDYSLLPPEDTMLDQLKAAGYAVIGGGGRSTISLPGKGSRNLCALPGTRKGLHGRWNIWTGF